MPDSSIVQHYCASDFYAFWSASQQFFSGKNPYQRSDYPSLLHGDECQNIFPYALMNPPPGLPLLFPFAGSSISQAVSIYLLLFAAALMVSLYLSRNNVPTRSPIDWLPIITFSPVFLCLMLGQMAIFNALFFSLFLVLFSRQRYLLAGVVLSLTLTKPHLLYLLYVLVVFHSLQVPAMRRCLLGFLSGMLMLASLAEWIQPGIFTHYCHALENVYSHDWITPTIGTWIRLVFPGEDRGWIVPLFVGIFFACREVYLARPPSQQQFMKFALISILTTPYVWIYDLPVLLPLLCCIFAGECRLPERAVERRWVAVVFAALSILVFPGYFYRIIDLILPWLLLVCWFRYGCNEDPHPDDPIKAC